MGTKFECSLCLEDFKDPRILVCFHTFCRNCLEDYLTNSLGSNLSGVTFECPLCRFKTTLSSDGIDGIQKNFYLDQEDQKPGPQVCSLHPKEDLRFYCRDCKTPICRDCKVVSHEGHTTDMVSEMITKMKQKLDDVLNTTEKTINENEVEAYTSVTKEIETVEKIMAHLKGKSLETKQEIDSLLGIVISVFQTHWGKKKQKKLTMAKSFEEKRMKLNEYQTSVTHAVDQSELNTLFRLDEEVVENGEEISRLKQLPHESPSSCADEVDDSDLRLEMQFVQLTEKIHNCIKDFRESGPVQEVFESFYKRTWTSRASTSGYSESGAISEDDGPQEDTSSNSIPEECKARQNTDSERKPYQDPDVIAVCHICGSSSQNRPNCAACGQRFTLYTAYYSKDNKETKRQKLNDTPQTFTQEDNDDCVVMSTDFPKQTGVKKHPPAQLSRRTSARGFIWESVDRIHVNKKGHQRKRRQKKGMHIPVSISTDSTNPYVPANPYMPLLAGSRDLEEKQETWNCTACTFTNRQEGTKCECCAVPRSAGETDEGATTTSLRGPVGFEDIDASLSYKPDSPHPFQPGHVDTDQSDPSTSSAAIPINNSIWCPYPERRDLEPYPRATLSQNHPSTPLAGDVKTTVPKAAHIQESKPFSYPFSPPYASTSGIGTASPRIAHSQESNLYLKYYTTPTDLYSSAGTTGPWIAHSQDTKPYINQFASPSNTFSSSTGTSTPRPAHIQESKPNLNPFAPSFNPMTDTTAPSVAHVPESNPYLDSAAAHSGLNSPIDRTTYIPRSPYGPLDSPVGTPRPRIAHSQDSHLSASDPPALNFPPSPAASRIVHNQETNPVPNSVSLPYPGNHMPVDLQQSNTIQGTNSDWDVLNKIWEKP